MRLAVVLSFSLLMIASAIAGTEDFAFPSVDSPEQFEKMSLPGGGIVRTGRTLRFVIDNRPGHAPAIRYAHGNYRDRSGKIPDYVRYHFDFTTQAFAASLREFLKKAPEDEIDADDIEKFNAASYFTVESKRFVAGVIHSYPIGAGTTYAIQFYPQDKANERQILDTARIVKATFRAQGRGQLHFVATGEQQTTRTIRNELRALGVRDFTIGRVHANSHYFAAEMGEATGILKAAPADPATLDPWDIVVYEGIPERLPVVAGAVTVDFPGYDSPFTLLAKERRTPAAMMRGDQLARLTRLLGKPVRLKVEEGDFQVEEYDGDPRADWEAKRPAARRPAWRAADAGRDLPKLVEMCGGRPAACLAEKPQVFGVRATHAGYLADPATRERVGRRLKITAEAVRALVPQGFAVSAGLAHSAAEGTADALASIARAGARDFAPGTRVRVEPSPAAEDLNDWEGPGRYTAATAVVGDTASFAAAVRTIYDGLRSREMAAERSALGIVTGDVRAGLLVTAEPAATTATTGEVITRVVNVKDVYGYTWAAHAGTAPVTRPDHQDRWAVETGIATFGRDWELDTALGFSITRPSLRAGGSSFLQQAPEGPFAQASRELLKLAAAVEIAYCNDTAGYYPLPPKAEVTQAEACTAMPSDNRKPNAIAVGFRGDTAGFRLTGFRRFLGR